MLCVTVYVLVGLFVSGLVCGVADEEDETKLTLYAVLWPLVILAAFWLLCYAIGRCITKI